jgi:hypothetical protein
MQGQQDYLPARESSQRSLPDELLIRLKKNRHLERITRRYSFENQKGLHVKVHGNSSFCKFTYLVANLAYLSCRALSALQSGIDGSVLEISRLPRPWGVLHAVAHFIGSKLSKTAQAIPDWTTKVFGKELHAAKQLEKSGRGR